MYHLPLHNYCLQIHRLDDAWGYKQVAAFFFIIKCKMLKCQRKINWEQSALHLPKGVSEVWGSRLSHSFQGTLLLPVSPLAYCPKYPQTTKPMAENTQMVICTTFQYDSTSIIYIATLPEPWSPVRISSHLRIQLEDGLLLSLWHIISRREGDLENVGFHVWKHHQNNINNDEGSVWQLAFTATT